MGDCFQIMPLRVKIIDLNGDYSEGWAKIDYAGLNLYCFLPYWMFEDWFSHEIKEIKKENFGVVRDLYIRLLASEIKHLENHVKNITQYETDPSSKAKFTVICGKVIHKEIVNDEDPKYVLTNYVIDCGIQIIVKLCDADEILELYDYIVAKGRLDAYLAVNEGQIRNLLNF